MIDSTRRPPCTRALILVALAIGLFVMLMAAVNYSYQPSGAMSDFDQVYIAARALLVHADPYTAVSATGWPFPLYYPGTAAVVVTPLALLPAAWARAAFMGIGAGLCAWGLARHRWYGLLGMLSGSFFAAFSLAQWAPLMVGAAFLSAGAAGAILSAKPTIGLAFACAYFVTGIRRIVWFLAGGLTVVVVSLLLRPSWPIEWLGAIKDAPNIFAIVTVLPWGPLVLLSVLRWRRPEARLLFAMACIPQTPFLYSALALFLVPVSRLEVMTLVLLSDAAWFLYRVFPNHLPPSPAVLAHYFRQTAWIPIILMYLPCVVMVLRRPNEGDVPAWLNGVSRRLLTRRPVQSRGVE